MTHTIKLDKFLKMFTASEDRPRLQFPVIDGDKVVASNGHMLIVAPISLFEMKYEGITDQYPEYKKVIPEYGADVLFTTDAKFIYEEAMMLMHLDRYSDCERCEGEGNLYTNLRNEVECDECGGTGHDEFLGHLIPVPHAKDKSKEKTFLFTINEVPFSPNLMEDISKISMEIGEPMNWMKCEPNKAAVIHVGEVMMLVMPMRWGKEDEDDYEAELTKIPIPRPK